MKKIFIIIIILFSKISLAIDVDDAIKSTIENNPKVKIAFEKLEESKELIENAYNVSSDLGHVSEVIATQGIDGIKKFEISVSSSRFVVPSILSKNCAISANFIIN